MGDRRRVVVTGGAGFVGSHLVDRLRADGAEVLVIDDLSTGRAQNLSPDVPLERLDIAADDVAGVIRRWRPSLVYHLAAQSSVPRSLEDPARDLAVNVTGTGRVVDATRASGSARFVFVSSGGAVYGETPRAATERTRPAPLSPYGVNKLAAEGVVAASGVPFAIARPSNIYGPRQAAGLEGAVVASFLAAAAAGEPLTIHGDGRQSRDFVHVRDVVAALVLLADDRTPPGIWNVASGTAVSIARLADLVEAAARRPLGRRALPRRAGDVTRSALSGRRLRGLGWRPRTRLARGIAELLAVVGR